MQLSSQSAKNVCRLIVDQPAGGAWNMAVDEALLEAVADDQTPTLRIYQWDRPTLSLGYFQPYAERESHPSSRNADVVRRLSGGGAIIHDQELTYSLILPSRHPLAADTQLLYNSVHRALVAWLNSLVAMPKPPWKLTLCENTTIGTAPSEQPFLCFQRRSPGDVLWVDDQGEHKIVGSAQRRRHGSVLQHGSILWATSPAAPEVCGFTQLAELAVPLAEAVELLSTDFPTLVGLECARSPLPQDVAKSAENKLKDRYQSPMWNQRR